MIGRSFRSRVGGMRIIFRGLRKKGAVKLQGPVHLIGRDMIETFPVILSVPAYFSGLQQRQGPHHIRLSKGKRIFDRTVYMAFRCQMDHSVDTVLPEQFQYLFKITDICFYKSIIRLLFDVCQIGQIPRISQLIQINDMIFRIFRHKQTHYMRADKTGTTGNQYIPFKIHYFRFNSFIHFTSESFQ